MTLILCVLCTAWDFLWRIIIYSDYALQKSNGSDNNPQSSFCSLKWVISVALKIFPDYKWLFPCQVLTRPGLPFPSWQKVSGWKGFGLETEFLIWPASQMGLLFLAKMLSAYSRKSSIIQRDLSNANSLNKKMCHDRGSKNGESVAESVLLKGNFLYQRFSPRNAFDPVTLQTAESRGVTGFVEILTHLPEVGGLRYWCFLCLTPCSLRSTSKHHLTLYRNFILLVAYIMLWCWDNSFQIQNLRKKLDINSWCSSPHFFF